MDLISTDDFIEISDYAIVSRSQIIDINQFNTNKIIFCNTHKLIELFEILKDNKNRFILITHYSDYNIEPEYVRRKPDCIVTWFGQNIINDYGENIKPIPIGFFTKERGNAFSNPILEKTFYENIQRTKNVYFNTCINTNLGERERAWEYSRRIPNSLVFQNERFDLKDYIRNIAECNWVISPPGYGIDCFRTWETLALGRIPVVKRSYATEYFAKLFPIILIDLWEDLNLSFLLRETEKVLESRDPLYRNLLTPHFWKSLILAEKEKL